MSYKGLLKYRRGTSYTVSFPTAPSLTVQPAEVDLYQEKSSHDVLELIYPVDSKTWSNTLFTGTPVIFTWRQEGRINTWTGYVTHISTQSAAQLRKEMKIVCVGASYVLKERGNRIWKNKTVTEVAKEIAKQFRFKFVGEASSRRFEQLSMTGQTYFSWLSEHAEKIGYGFYIDNTTMYLRPLSKLLKDSASNAPIMFLETPSPAAAAKAWDRTLDSFIVKKADYQDGVDAPHTRKTTAGVSPLTSKRISNTASPTKIGAFDGRVNKRSPIFEDYPLDVVHSSAFSKSTAKDLAFAAKFVTLAKARGQGDPRLRPYSALYIGNTGANTDGYWLVNKVHHVFTITGLYEVDVDVATDGIGPNTGELLRKSIGLKQGTLDIEALVANGSAGIEASKGRSALVAKRLLIKESNQGFNGNPRYWSK